MKNLILIILLSFLTCTVYSQDIKKNSLVRIQTISEITPKSGYTVKDFEEFYQKEVIKSYEENLPEVKFYPAKAVRGDKEGSLGVIWFAESQDVYYKYHHSDGSYTETGQAARQEIEQTLNKLDEIATYKNIITDWVVQE